MLVYSRNDLFNVCVSVSGFGMKAGTAFTYDLSGETDLR